MPDPATLHKESVVVDFHAHPSLKSYLFGTNIAKRHGSTSKWWPFSLRTDWPKLIEGNVDCILSTIYLPEIQILDDCKWSRILTWLNPKFKRTLRGDPFEETTKLLDDFERKVAEARVDGRQVARIARSLSEMKAVLANNQIAILHSIEGAHSLAGKKGHVQELFERGVCLITLGHFYENEVVATVDAIPESYKKFGCFRMPHDLSRGLMAKGKEIVEEMIRLGIIIDLTHSTPKARAEIYEINNNQRPIVISHVGVEKFFNHAMNPSDQEIEIIARTGGAIGVIFFNYWLCGDAERGNGIDLLVKTINHIKNVGGIDAVAIGTDFDGFTDPPDDLKDPSELGRLTNALLQDGFSEAEIKKILGENIQRVLEKGWGRQ